MEEEDQKELQLLPNPHSMVSDPHQFEGEMAPSLDLQLTISVRPIHHHHHHQIQPLCEYNTSCVEAVKWQAAEQIRMAAIEKAYAERVRELTKREMELAHSDFTRASQIWETVGEELQKAERLKEIATRSHIHNSTTCMEITCHSCNQRFIRH